MSDENIPEGPTENRFWTEEKLDVWVRVGIPALATVVIGLSTIYINHSISQRAERAESSRLYTELISRREQASSDLRKDMFATILSGFLEGQAAPGSAAVGGKRLDQDLMKLELLALNFGEALSLGPLFAMMDRQIRTPDAYASAKERVDQRRYQARLESLARRVADTQRGSLEGESQEFELTVSPEIGEVGTFLWPGSEEDEEYRACRTLNRVQRRFELSFSNVRAEPRTVDVGMIINTLALTPGAPEECVRELVGCALELPASCIDHQETSSTVTEFTLDPFNLPLIDNALLSDDQRFSLILRRFHPDASLDIVGVLFPGKFAGRRDKLTLDQAIESLNGRM